MTKATASSQALSVSMINFRMGFSLNRDEYSGCLMPAQTDDTPAKCATRVSPGAIRPVVYSRRAVFLICKGPSLRISPSHATSRRSPIVSINSSTDEVIPVETELLRTNTDLNADILLELRAKLWAPTMPKGMGRHGFAYSGDRPSL